MSAVKIRCTYILPIRRTIRQRGETEQLARYFKSMARAGCEVVVVDGSSSDVFTAHDRAWRGVCRHVAVDRKYAYLNDKVNGVHTGVDLASCENIVLADDDIRYTRRDIDRMGDLLRRYEMVKPQNYLSPIPWWARTEAARMLINRGVLRTGDYPGTCAFRRSTFLRVGHYDGDVLFDNEEIVRHFMVNGANVCHAVDFFILKCPPPFRKWLEQRPRQAYEDFALLAKTLLFISLLPLVVGAGLISGARAALGLFSLLSIGAVLLAGRGLWRDRAYNFFPAYVVIYAPLWIIERAISVYWALYWRLARGGYPFGERLLVKGTGRDWFAARTHMRKRDGLIGLLR